MNTGAKASAEPRTHTPPILAATLRTLAGDLRAGADLSALLAAMGRALASVPTLRGFTVEPADGAHEFAADRLSVPLLGSAGALGAIKIAPGGGGVFRASRLQLAGAIATSPP